MNALNALTALNTLNSLVGHGPGRASCLLIGKRHV
jgi:hypothetical protein